MKLDPDAQASADLLKELLPRPLHTLGVAGAREWVRARASDLPPPVIHEVYDRTVPGAEAEIPVRVYRPGPEAGLPVLVYLHGGGWTVGGLNGVDALCRTLSTAAGCVVVSVDYRLAPEHKFPEPLDDCFRALTWVSSHAAELGADSSRIAIGGDSAGANLSVAVCLLARDRGGPPIVFQLLAYPPTEYGVPRPSWTEYADGPLITSDDVLWFWDQYLRDEADRADPLAVPANARDLRGLPPAFIITAECDPLRDGGEDFARRLREDGVRSAAKRYPGVFHAFFTEVGTIARAKEAVDDAARHLVHAFGADTQDASS
ncbi:alpha/beta hydrolase [Streptomyces sp. NBC_00582]|uniref:alpha/beta hydrolase n=1 Tax=Streptomyces sp. NBC_00582 TaxID=2975783 RepID=UPI001062B46F|nr:alpha/beta hydrolase [Streptomyces sp. NBC_00582]WUB59280.1 alpha/beta hydrolase [Streptomyces sp. NBC_00582]